MFLLHDIYSMIFPSGSVMPVSSNAW